MLRNIQIEPVLNGYLVQYGCQRIVFDSPGKLIAALTDVFANPEKVEEEFMAKAINKSNHPTPPATDCAGAQTLGAVTCAPIQIGAIPNRRY